MSQIDRGVKDLVQHSGRSQSSDSNQLKSQKAIKVMSGLLARAQLAMRAMMPFGGKRNLWQSFGYPEQISPHDVMRMYNRGGVAKRVAHAYPDAVWGRPPTLWVQGDDSWAAEWAKFCDENDVWQALYRLDVLSSLGAYGLLLIGTNKGNLTTELRSNAQLTFLQPYSEENARIMSWDGAETSPNFGRPLLYRLNPENDSRQLYGSHLGSMPVRRPLEVHHSRTLHVAHSALENGIFGRPLYASIWNYLVDLEKVVGSAAESYWMTANRGIVANVDKEIEMDAQDSADLSDEIDEYQHGQRRFIRTRGVEVTSLGTDVADPQGAFKVLVTLISGTTGIPQRVLLGSESGRLASTQDKGNWSERVEEYRTLHAQPTILKPFVQKMIAIGAVRKPNGPVNILWPDAYRMSPLERGQTSAQTARTIANIVKMMESENVEVKNLLTKDEVRAIIGLSSDNRVLATDPNV